MAEAAGRSPGKARGLFEGKQRGHRRARHDSIAIRGDLPAVRIEAENEWAWCGDRRLTDAEGVRGPALPRRAPGTAGHEGRAARRGLARHDRERSRAHELHPRPAEGARRLVARAALHRDGPSARLPLHRSVAGPGAAAARGRRPRGRRGSPRRAGRRRWSAATPSSRGCTRCFATRAGRAAAARLRDRRAGDRQDDARRGVSRARSARASALRVGRGQCVEQYGAGEAYLPVLEALGRLGREPGGDAARRGPQAARADLARAAAGAARPTTSSRRCSGARRARRASACCASWSRRSTRSPRDAPLVLVLEDLHWSDSATVDLLAMLARRRDAARLLVVGTYRPADVAAGDASAEGR